MNFYEIDITPQSKLFFFFFLESTPKSKHNLSSFTRCRKNYIYDIAIKKRKIWLFMWIMAMYFKLVVF